MSIDLNFLVEQLRDRFEKADHAIATSGSTRTHTALGEIFLCGTLGVQTNVGETNQDWVIENPTDSGKTVEVVQFTPSASIGYRTEKYYNVDLPSGGTEIDPWNTTDRSLTATFNAKHGGDIADTSTADRQIPNGLVGGSGNQSFGPYEVNGAEYTLGPGQSLLFRTVLDSANENFGILATVAEKDEGRAIEAKPRK